MHQSSSSDCLRGLQSASLAISLPMSCTACAAKPLRLFPSNLGFLTAAAASTSNVRHFQTSQKKYLLFSTPRVGHFTKYLKRADPQQTDSATIHTISVPVSGQHSRQATLRPQKSGSSGRPYAAAYLDGKIELKEKNARNTVESLESDGSSTPLKGPYDEKLVGLFWKRTIHELDSGTNVLARKSQTASEGVLNQSLSNRRRSRVGAQPNYVDTIGRIAPIYRSHKNHDWGSGNPIASMKTLGEASNNLVHKREPWQVQKKALLEKFGSSGWSPRKRLSPDSLEGIRALHAQYPDKYTTPVLADQFKVSPEAVRRILKSKWRPNDDEEDSRRDRWNKRGVNIWSQMNELGIKPPRKWRDQGVGKSVERIESSDSTLHKAWSENGRLVGNFPTTSAAAIRDSAQTVPLADMIL